MIVREPPWKDYVILSTDPVFSIEGQDFVIATQYMAAVPKGELRSCVGNLAEQQDEISAALDMLFLGFDARKS